MSHAAPESASESPSTEVIRYGEPHALKWDSLLGIGIVLLIIISVVTILSLGFVVTSFGTQVDLLDWFFLPQWLIDRNIYFLLVKLDVPHQRHGLSWRYQALLRLEPFISHKYPGILDPTLTFTKKIEPNTTESSLSETPLFHPEVFRSNMTFFSTIFFSLQSLSYFFLPYVGWQLNTTWFSIIRSVLLLPTDTETLFTLRIIIFVFYSIYAMFLAYHAIRNTEWFDTNLSYLPDSPGKFLHNIFILAAGPSIAWIVLTTMTRCGDYWLVRYCWSTEHSLSFSWSFVCFLIFCPLTIFFVGMASSADGVFTFDYFPFSIVQYSIYVWILPTLWTLTESGNLSPRIPAYTAIVFSSLLLIFQFCFQTRIGFRNSIKINNARTAFLAAHVAAAALVLYREDGLVLIHSLNGIFIIAAVLVISYIINTFRASRFVVPSTQFWDSLGTTLSKNNITHQNNRLFLERFYVFILELLLDHSLSTLLNSPTSLLDVWSPPGPTGTFSKFYSGKHLQDPVASRKLAEIHKNVVVDDVEAPADDDVTHLASTSSTPAISSSSSSSSSSELSKNKPYIRGNYVGYPLEGTQHDLLANSKHIWDTYTSVSLVSRYTRFSKEINKHVTVSSRGFQSDVFYHLDGASMCASLIIYYQHRFAQLGNQNRPLGYARSPYDSLFPLWLMPEVRRAAQIWNSPSTVESIPSSEGFDLPHPPFIQEFINARKFRFFLISRMDRNPNFNGLAAAESITHYLFWILIHGYDWLLLHDALYAVSSQNWGSHRTGEAAWNNTKEIAKKSYLVSIFPQLIEEEFLINEGKHKPDPNVATMLTFLRTFPDVQQLCEDNLDGD